MAFLGYSLSFSLDTLITLRPRSLRLECIFRIQTDTSQNHPHKYIHSHFPFNFFRFSAFYCCKTNENNDISNGWIFTISFFIPSDDGQILKSLEEQNTKEVCKFSHESLSTKLLPFPSLIFHFSSLCHLFGARFHHWIIFNGKGHKSQFFFFHSPNRQRAQNFHRDYVICFRTLC